MKKIKLILITASLLSAAGCSTAEGNKGTAESSKATAKAPVQPMASHNQAAPQAHKPDDGHGHGHGHGADEGRVPAFEKDPLKLPATLAPEQFTGMTRKAYQAVREIPKTIAQLPCYCHCDRGFGHKSLHSCYVDNHAAGCAVCVEEVLMAYRLEKEEKLTPEQIRERIIAEYSKGH